MTNKLKYDFLNLFLTKMLLLLLGLFHKKIFLRHLKIVSINRVLNLRNCNFCEVLHQLLS